MSESGAPVPAATTFAEKRAAWLRYIGLTEESLSKDKVEYKLIATPNQTWSDGYDAHAEQERQAAVDVARLRAIAEAARNWRSNIAGPNYQKAANLLAAAVDEHWVWTWMPGGGPRRGGVMDQTQASTPVEIPPWEYETQLRVLRDAIVEAAIVWNEADDAHARSVAAALTHAVLIYQAFEAEHESGVQG